MWKNRGVRVLLAFVAVIGLGYFGWSSLIQRGIAGATEVQGPFSEARLAADRAYENKRWERAVEGYREMTRQDRFNGVAHYRLGVSLLNALDDGLLGAEGTPPVEGAAEPAEPALKPLDEALAALQNAQRHSFLDGVSAYGLARIYCRKGELELAVENLKKARQAGVRINVANIELHFAALKDQPFYRELLESLNRRAFDSR